MNDESGKLGALECIMITVGGMVGCAIFSLSGLTYSIAGPAVILSWIIGGAILLIYGLNCAELVTIYPTASGGIFVFPYETLGKTETAKKGWGWFAAWSLMNVNIFGAGFAAIYLAIFLGNSFPALSSQVVLIAVIATIILGVLCCFNITVAGAANTIMTIILICILVLFGIMCAASGSFSAANFTPFFTRGVGGGTGFITAIPVAMLAYNAIAGTAFLATQIKNAKRTIPRVMVIAMIITIVIYLFGIVGVIGTMPVEMLTAADTSWTQYAAMFAVCSFFMQQWPWMAYLITFAGVFALATTMLVLMMIGGWTLQAAAEKGLLPSVLAKVNPKTGTPTLAMILVTIAVVICSCFPNFVNEITNCGAICSAVMVVMIAITLLKARKQHPYKEGDFRVAGGSVLPILSIILIVFFIIPGVFQKWSYWGMAGIWYIAGIIIFFICKASVKGNKSSAK